MGRPIMVKETNWHGWSLSDKEGTVCVGCLPGRIHVALYRETPKGIEPLAYFRSVEDAAWMLEFLDSLAKAEGQP
jgi:hypothetical protein